MTAWNRCACLALVITSCLAAPRRRQDAALGLTRRSPDRRSVLAERVVHQPVRAIRARHAGRARQAVEIVPALATNWQQVNNTTWRFNLRNGVKFHDGAPFTADDVVFSIERAQHPNSQQRQYANLIGKPRKIDDYTVELVTEKPNPILLAHATQYLGHESAPGRSRHKVERPLDFKNKEETYASNHANGTGPFILVSREPGVKTVLRKNPEWWGIADGRFEGNITEIVYTQISSEATRVAALMAGQIDFILDPPPQDLARLRRSRRSRSSRVRRTASSSSDLTSSATNCCTRTSRARTRSRTCACVRRSTTRSTSRRCAAASCAARRCPPAASRPRRWHPIRDAEKRLPFDVNRAKQLLAEAGYPNGFEVTLDCPNNRYINDEQICLAVAAMMTRVGIQTKVTTMPRATYFPKLEKFETSMYMLGWGGCDNRRPVHAVAGAAQPRQGDRPGRLQLRPLQQSRSSTR